LVWNAHRVISLCDLEANPSFYAGKTVRFRAIVERTKYIVVACSFCGVDTATAAASIELDPGEVAKFTLPESLMSGGEGDQIYLMDAVVIGQLDPHFGPGCFADSRQSVEWVKSNSY
jgi:hypothetical protein